MSYRIIARIGWEFIMLPEDTPIEMIKYLINAVRVNQTGLKWELAEIATDPTVTVVGASSVNKIAEYKNMSEEHRFLVEVLKQKLDGKKHKLIKFGEKEIVVEGKSVPYPDISNPNFDPDEFINRLVALATKD